MVANMGLEPTAFGLVNRRSASELVRAGIHHARIGGIRVSPCPYRAGRRTREDSRTSPADNALMMNGGVPLPDGGGTKDENSPGSTVLSPAAWFGVHRH